MSAWKAILAALVIFGAGLVTGAVAHKLLDNRTRPFRVGAGATVTPWTAQRKAFLRRMDRELELDPTQHERIQQIINESQERLKKLWEPVAPQAREEFHRVRIEIRAELKPAQREKFDAMFHKGAHRPDNGSTNHNRPTPATNADLPAPAAKP